MVNYGRRDCGMTNYACLCFDLFCNWELIIRLLSNVIKSHAALVGSGLEFTLSIRSSIVQDEVQAVAMAIF